MTKKVKITKKIIYLITLWPFCTFMMVFLFRLMLEDLSVPIKIADQLGVLLGCAFGGYVGTLILKSDS